MVGIFGSVSSSVIGNSELEVVVDFQEFQLGLYSTWDHGCRYPAQHFKTCFTRSDMTGARSV